VVSFPITVEISAAAIRANVRAIRRRLAVGTPVCAAVKAGAYGHSIEHVLPILTRAGIERVAVANLPEAIQVRKLGWTRPVLCLGSVLASDTEEDRVERARTLVEMGFHCTITTLEEARLLSAEAVRMHRPARVEVKIDTGMGRLGVRPEAAEELIAAVAALPAVSLDGVYTHFATADDDDLAFAHEQLDRFHALKNAIQKRGIRVGLYHAANSAAVFRLPETHLGMVRPGLAVYGCWGGPEAQRPPDLVPALRVVGRLTVVRGLPAGHPVGYGCTFHTSRPSIIGVVPIGYADGYRRALSNDTVMTLEPVRDQPRRFVPVVGRVSMDQTTVDLTDAGDVREGDPITIIDSDPTAPNSVEGTARKLRTIPYEITCLLGPRAPRVLVRSEMAEPQLEIRSGVVA
jgi:alanine racemase